MTYERPHLRLVVAGTIYTERWSWSINFPASFNNPPFDEPETVSQAVQDAVQTFHVASGVTRSHAKLDSIKVNLIGMDGLYMNPSTVEWNPGTPVAGAAATVALPAQVALAVTLRTDVARGLANSGRFYIPVPAPDPNLTDGRITIAQATTVATAATTMLNALNTALPGFRAGVMSKVGAGTTRFVTHVEVGRVLDTIRSRRSSLPEDHVAGSTLAA